MTIDVPDPDQLVRELLFLEKAMKGKEDLDPFPEIVEGALCRVKAGPYQGMEGVVIKKDGKTNIILEVTIIGQAATMEIDPNMVERID
jgi:transcription antitermination factor NusG